jgi:hypothetical protein
MKNKRGLSAIVVTLIIVLVSIVAVGIIWVAISNLVNTNTQDIGFAQKCLNLQIKVSSIDCTDPTACNVSFERTGTSQEEIAGIKIMFKDSKTGETSSLKEGAVGNIETLVGKTINEINSELSNPDTIEVTPYFEDEAGNDKLCSTSILKFE